MNKILTNYYTVRKEHDKCLGQLDKECTRIIKSIYKAFGKKYKWWSYKYYESGDPPLPDKIDEDYFPVNIDGNEVVTDEWDYNNAIPLIFFDMTSEEIVAHIKKEISDCEKRERIK